MAKLEEQSLPETVKCPECGNDERKQLEIKHGLSNNGYYHDDIGMECGECGYNWVHGVPINAGENPVGDDLFCDVCEQGFMLVHRVDTLPDSDSVLLQLKCPECFFYKKTSRHPDDLGLALIGYPPITGELNMEKPDGFVPGKLDGGVEATGLKERFETRIEGLENEENGMPTSVTQRDVVIARVENYEDASLFDNLPSEVEVKVFGDEQAEKVGVGKGFYRENGQVFCDVEVEGTVFDEKWSVVPVHNSEKVTRLLLKEEPVDTELRQNLVHKENL